MNHARDELSALDRITKLIKRFDQQVADPLQGSKHSIDVYLKQQLSPQDWTFWEQLQDSPDELLENYQIPLVDHTSTGQHFNYLLGQYRRAGFEVYQTWCQLREQSGFDMTDLNLND
ncbi:hypothetical protein [Spirosoma foliorum]|uniref:Uncharacterized protein n=1 Tax=Spirosoma foliorum TaxID=2710596 RepID=A0A7G5H539_9BACT|nr:hypothetical protein [Spirosoma foliorum]QMW06231.1 hypothetical protein H3H32_15755 [Spirosoma foliorum]